MKARLAVAEGIHPIGNEPVLVHAFLIWQGWPGTAAWAIGMLTGINLLFMGLSLVMLATSSQKSSSK